MEVRKSSTVGTAAAAVAEDDMIGGGGALGDERGLSSPSPNAFMERHHQIREYIQTWIIPIIQKYHLIPGSLSEVAGSGKVGPLLDELYWRVSEEYWTTLSTGTIDDDLKLKDFRTLLDILYRVHRLMETLKRSY